MAPKRKTSFQIAWLSNPDYMDWLRKKSDTHGTCLMCKKDFSIAWGGEAGVKSHVSSALHAKLAKEHSESKKSLSIFHFVPTSLPSPPTSSPASTNPTTVDTSTSMILPLSVQHAEIYWVLKVVMSHFSLRSCLEIKTLFQAMFPDSEIAKQFQLSKTKCALPT